MQQDATDAKPRSSQRRALAWGATMIPVQSVLLVRMLRTGWAVGGLALLMAMLVEWGLISRN